MKPPDGYNALLEQAALWDEVLKHEDTPEHRRAYGDWLMRSPQHVKATLQWQWAVAAHAATGCTTALPESEPFQVIELGTMTKSVRIQSRTLLTRGQRLLLRPTRRLWAASAACLAAVCASAFLFSRFQLPSQFAHSPRKPPPTAEQEPHDQFIDAPRFVQLAPGSLLRVGGDSQVRVHVAPRARRQTVTVLRGIAYFSGHHDTDQPLLVYSGRVVVSPVGTDFSVRNEQGFTELAVSAGVVHFACRPEEETGESLARAMIATKEAPKSLKVNTVARLASDCSRPARTRPLAAVASATGTSSEDGWLLFDDTPVKVATEMFNRANARCIFIVDKAVEKERVGGYFESSDLDNFLNALEKLGVRAIRTGSKSEGWVIHLVSGRSPTARSADGPVALQHR